MTKLLIRSGPLETYGDALYYLDCVDFWECFSRLPVYEAIATDRYMLDVEHSVRATRSDDER